MDVHKGYGLIAQAMHKHVIHEHSLMFLGTAFLSVFQCPNACVIRKKIFGLFCLAYLIIMPACVFVMYAYYTSMSIFDLCFSLWDSASSYKEHLALSKM